MDLESRRVKARVEGSGESAVASSSAARQSEGLRDGREHEIERREREEGRSGVRRACAPRVASSFLSRWSL
jgi:hypothetical protein